MRIETVHRVAQAKSDVLAWYDRPGALVRLTPPGIASVEDPSVGGMRAGRLVGARLGPAPLPAPLRPRWVLRHVESDPVGHFVDQQVSGPWRTWRHEHRLEADGTTGDTSTAGETATAGEASTVIRDSIEVELPRHLERLAPVAESQIRRLLAFRARQLRDDLAFHARFRGVPRRTIAITGSSGLIGTQLAALLETGGHTVHRMVRRSEVGPGEISWDPRAGELDAADLEGVDVVINLAGRSIATRWTPDARREIRDSRLDGTALIARTLAGMRGGPTALVQASAIGLYGPRRPGEVLTESDPGGEGFLADLVRDWEGSTRAADDAGVRVAHVRTGLALSDGGGSLLPQLPLFLAGVGGRLTAGRAMTSWISLDDIVRVFAHAALSADVAGPVNGVAPQPVTAREFARTLGEVLHRPALVPVPSFGPRLALGGAAADELIQVDQQVSSARLEQSGFVPAHARLEDALRHLLRR
ncbi:TIGR01777 family oxidoreductase [Brachybacterium sp. J153]|uniref:TIGR01777 family oxidoreductase n=1 Tax=Brachybacterium sp. J153 TaxID=3116488 RepID=UPI002E79E4D0|nr:TIGR01777 family oxidoreductase [Brachybacterium sp. J153]MEE1617786.1 TIGR01777 family oxidoreductase [Brachybacterium sp. J153]